MSPGLQELAKPGAICSNRWGVILAGSASRPVISRSGTMPLACGTSWPSLKQRPRSSQKVSGIAGLQGNEHRAVGCDGARVGDAAGDGRGGDGGRAAEEQLGVA